MGEQLLASVAAACGQVAEALAQHKNEH